MNADSESVFFNIGSDVSSSVQSLQNLSNTLQSLNAVLTSGTKRIGSFTKAIQSLSSINTVQIQSIVYNLNAINNFKASSELNRLADVLENVANLSPKINVKVVNQLADSSNKLKSNMSGLPSTVNATSNALNGLPNNLRKAADEVDNLSNKNSKIQQTSNLLSTLSKSFKLSVLVAGLTRGASTIGNFVNLSNEYIENLNLFNVSMGNMAKTASEFTENFSNILGVDPSNVMRYISIFNTLAEGFGIADEEAYKMSKNLTQLSYDMSSFLNIPIDEAMQKIKSGFSGEIEPMRAVGVALDEASLQETAYALGIDKKVSAMTRAQKSELLYYQIMTRTTKMQGDMARTLIQPANALKILQQEFTQLGRAIGNIFIPILMSLVPYIMVVTQWLTALAQSIANFFGFEIPEIDYGNISSGLGDVSGSIDGVGDSADKTTKKLNRMLAKFDELNVIEFDDDKTSGSGSGSGGVGTGGSLGIPLPDYDAITGKFNAGLEEAEKKLKSILPYVEAIGLGMLAWKISSSVLKFLDSLGLIKNMASALRVAAGVSLMISGGWLVYKGIRQFIEEGMTPDSMLKLLSGGALISAGGALSFKNPALLKLGLSVTIVLTLLTSIIDWWNGYFEEQKNFLYGDKKDLNLGEFINVSFSAVGQGFGNFLEQIFGEDFIENLVQYQWFLNDLWDNYLKPSIWNQRLGELWKTITEIIDLGWQGVKLAFDKGWEAIGKAFETGWKAIVDWWNNSAIGKWWNDNVAPWFTKEKWEDLFYNIGEALVNKWNETVTWWEEGGLKKWWNENVAPWFTKKKWQDLYNNIKQSLQDKWNETVTWWNNTAIVKWWNDNVAPWFTLEKWKNLANSIKEGISSKWNEFTSWFSNNGLSRWWNDNVAPWFTWQKWWSLAQDAINGIKNAFENLNIHIKLPHFRWTTQPASGWVADILSALNLPTSLPKLNVSWYAEGGLPDAGEVFVAREAGPELVGSIGNRAAVANNDQIIEGIKQGTYEAVSTAMRENNNSRQPVIVKIGEKTIYSGYGSYVDSQSNMYGTNYIRT